MVTKEQYVMKRVKSLIKHNLDKDTMINPITLNNLIGQWAFDYEMEKAHNPQALEKPYETTPINWDED